MPYHENTEQSAEYLRLALQRMARQHAGLHPVSYALWYEYVAGTNPALKAEVEAMTQGGGLLSEELPFMTGLNRSRGSGGSDWAPVDDQA